MALVKHGSEMSALRKTEKILEIFKMNFLRIGLGNSLTDRILNSMLYDKFC